jgi:hypothetical protein
LGKLFISIPHHNIIWYISTKGRKSVNQLLPHLVLSLEHESAILQK